ncbi:MAG: beta-lactamase family protein [Marinifilaceae bacterium]|jgi:CubicO group peptidase (beta-lactamase class C family)|nr:beta-lactamase family protein [Marinifilaceae bacterium]
MRINKCTIKLIVLVIAVIAAWMLVVPSYLRTSLIYWYANLDDYTIFENNTVEAENPKDWPLADNYNKQDLSKENRKYIEDHETFAYIIIKDGKLVFEEYWADYNKKTLSNIFSCTKSIVSLLFGAAIEDGKIKSLDEPIGKYIPEYANDERGQITIKNLLTMSSGLSWDEAYSSPFSITTKSYYGKKLRKVALNQILIEKPGVKFKYLSGNTQLLAFVLEKAVGKSVSDYAEEKLWKPLQATQSALWSLDKKDGDEKAFCCFNTNALDVARFGQLILDDGKWNNKQIIPEWYIKEASQAASYLENEFGDGQLDYYGYQIWILNKDGMQIPHLRGHRGQYIYALRDYNAIVVRLGNLKDEKVNRERTADVDKYIDIAIEYLKNSQ